MEILEPDEDAMADRRFVIWDLLALRGATLNIPPFACGKQLTAQVTTKTRRIARADHVERAMGCLKQFTMLQGDISYLYVWYYIVNAQHKRHTDVDNTFQMSLLH